MLNSPVFKKPCFISGMFAPASYSVAKWSNHCLPPILQYADHNPGGFGIGPNYITVPKKGFYRISFTYSCTDYGAIQGARILLTDAQEGNQRYVGGELHQGYGSYNSGSTDTIAFLNAGERIYFGVYCDQAGTFTIQNSPDRQGRFSAEYLGGAQNRIFSSILCFIKTKKEARIC